MDSFSTSPRRNAEEEPLQVAGTRGVSPDGDSELIWSRRVAAVVVTPSSAAVSARMSRHPRRDTRPELALRRGLHAAGHRYRVHYPVPGKPRRTIDIAFTRKRLALFVDGCFWHGCPEHGGIPSANSEWWREKLLKNKSRDANTDEHLRGLGWRVIRVWEHEGVGEALHRLQDVTRAS